MINISLFLDILCKCTLQRTALAFGFCLDITLFVLFKKALCEKYLMPTLIDKKSVKKINNEFEINVSFVKDAPNVSTLSWEKA